MDPLCLHRTGSKLEPYSSIQDHLHFVPDSGSDPYRSLSVPISYLFQTDPVPCKRCLRPQRNCVPIQKLLKIKYSTVNCLLSFMLAQTCRTRSSSKIHFSARTTNKIRLNKFHFKAVHFLLCHVWEQEIRKGLLTLVVT